MKPIIWMRLIRDSDASMVVQHVLQQLALRLDESGVGYCPNEQLRADAKVSLATVKRSTAWAREAGYLEQVRRGHRLGDGTQIANEWRLANLNGSPQSHRDEASTALPRAIETVSMAQSSVSMAPPRAPKRSITKRSKRTANADALPFEGLPEKPEPETAQVLVAEWIAHCPHRPPGQMIGQVSKQIKLMLDEGIEYQGIRRGLARWHEKRLHPSALPSIVHEAMNGAPQPRRLYRTDLVAPDTPEAWR